MPETTHQQRDPDPALLVTFDYTLADLLANRAGTVTLRQQQRIATTTRIGRSSTRLALSACLGSVALLFGGALLSQNGPELQQAWPYLLLGGLFFMGIFSGFAALGMLRMRNLQRYHVRIAEGQAVRTARTIRGGRWTAYAVTIGGIRFQLSSSNQFKQFQENQHYRIYYLHYPPTQFILAVE